MKTTYRLAAAMALLWTMACLAQQETTKSPPDNVERDAIVELADGSRLAGTLPAETSIQVQTSEMKATVAIKRIDTITMSDDHKTALVTMQNGDRLQGAIEADPLPLATAAGKKQVDFHAIRTLTVFAAGGPAAEGLVFWNTLANEKEALKSLVGPNPTIYKPHGDAAVTAGREFPGDHGGAITIVGSYVSEQSARNLALTDLKNVINPEEGCIEVWYCQAAKPLGYKYGVYRMFDGDYGSQSCAQLYSVPYGIVFELKCGDRQQEVTVPTRSVPDRKWIHLAAVWNRKGISGSHETMRIYIDGKEAVSGTSTDWGNTVVGEADICGGNDDCAHKFMIGNLKIWNREKTEFNPGKPPDVDPKKLPEIKEPAGEDDPDDPDSGG